MRRSVSLVVSSSFAAALLLACGNDDPAAAPAAQGGASGSKATAGGTSGAPTGGSGGSPSAAGSGGSPSAGGSAGASATGGSAGAGEATNAWRTLSFTGTGFAIHEGSKLAVSVSRADTGQVVGGKALEAQTGDTFSFAWPGLLAPGVAYNVDYYADLNNNKACDAPTTDHVWRRTVAAADTGTLAVVHDAVWTDQCPSFATLSSRRSLSFTGTGFVIHEKSKIEIVVTRAADGVAVAHGGYTGLEGDKLSFSWDGLLEMGQAYSVDYYADLNNDKRCNPPADDHVWHRDIPVVTDNVKLEVVHDSIWVNVCSSFSK